MGDERGVWESEDVPPFQGLDFYGAVDLGLARFGAGGTLGCNIAGPWPFRNENPGEP
jgi:hypothetical protein